MGFPGFVAKVKADLGIAARHREIDLSGATGVLREPEAAYDHEIAAENDHPSEGNRYLWNEA